ncbi:MAG: hypothetical protein AAGA85_19010 [Bacteroidota bacterium]
MSAYAQGAEQDSLQQKRIEKFESWKWRISPYAWVPAIRGRVTTPSVFPSQLPEPPPPFFDFKLLVKDLRSHLKFLSVISAEYRSDRFLFAGRFDALVIESQPVFILESLLDQTLVDFALYSADLFGGYRFLTDEKVHLDGLVGLRMLHLNVGVHTLVFGNEIGATQKKTYWDPVLGARLKYLPHYRWELIFYADITPIPLESNFSFQGVSVITYHFNPHFFLAPGYRFVGHRKTDDEVTYFDGNIRGFYLRIGFQF